jgi:hypothetical protein
MSIVSWREVSGRTISHRFGEAPTAERRFIVTLDNTAADSNEIFNAIGIPHGSPHPEYPFITAVEGTITEGSPDPFHAEVAYRYELINPDDRDPNPLARLDVWQFSTGGAAVPALYYYDGTTREALVNSAGDYFEGMTRDEAECRATISANREVFPLATAIAVTNTVNNATYLGAPAHHWKCTGISGQQQIEMVNGAEVRYWAITSELVYRQSGWNLLIPDVGYNYIDGFDKKRAFVIDPESGDKVACVNPIALESDGSMKAAGDLPDILSRRVDRESDFNVFFGSPPWL